MKNRIRLVAVHIFILLFTCNGAFGQSRMYNSNWNTWVTPPLKMPEAPRTFTVPHYQWMRPMSTPIFNSTPTTDKSYYSGAIDNSPIEYVPHTQQRYHFNRGWYVPGRRGWEVHDTVANQIYQGGWDLSTHKKNGAGTLSDQDGAILQDGDWVQDFFKGDSAYYTGKRNPVTGKKEGNGTKNYVNGFVYTGHWKDDKKEGRGTQTDPQGKYDGAWVNDMFEGSGTYTYTDGAKYTGSFKKDKRSGRGVLSFADGFKYEGEFNNDRFNGTGTLTWPNGDTYIGEWKNDSMSGNGTHKWMDGSWYKGYFSQNLMNGTGTYMYPSGNKYAGHFEEGIFTGEGTFYWTNGEKYVGLWYNDKRNGHGVLYDKHGGIITDCMWQDNKPKGDLYYGRYKNGKRNGHGALIMTDGLTYKGNWKDDMKEGQGKLTDATGAVLHEGRWENDKFIGN